MRLPGQRDRLDHEVSSGPILCATDLSPSADEGLRQATALTACDGARLVVLHVIESPRAQSPVRAVPDEANDADVERSVADHVVAVTGLPREGFDLCIRDGAPYAAIVEEGDRRAAQRIVVGSQGASGLRRLLIGSVADKVVRYAHEPVLVARASPPNGPVLAATDFSDPSLPALQAAAREAERRGVTLEALHCLDIPAQSMAWGPGTAMALPVLTEDDRQALVAAGKAHLDAVLAGAGVTAGAHVHDGPPASAILAAAGSLGASLVVVGTVGRTGLRRMLLGSVAETVVRDAGCSVLVVRLRVTS